MKDCIWEKGEAHRASNSYLADSLLQLLIWLNVTSKPLFGSSNTEKKWRRDACLAVRAHLCNHEEVALHPRQRDSTSAIAQDATAEEDALVDLEHHRHGIAIVKLFLTCSGLVQEEARKGFRIVVHSRFDERVDLFMDAPTVCLDATLQVPHIDLRFYKHTGNCVTGFHYDPVFLRRLRPRGSALASQTTIKGKHMSDLQRWAQPRLRQTCQKASVLCGVARGH